MRKITFVVVGLLLTGFAQSVEAQTGIRGYLSEHAAGRAVPRQTQPVDQVAAIQADTLNSISAWQGGYNPWLGGYGVSRKEALIVGGIALVAKAIGNQRSNKATEHGGQNQGSYFPGASATTVQCKIAGDTILKNGELDDPMVIEFIDSDGRPLDQSWVAKVAKDRKVKEKNGQIWLQGGGFACLPYPIGFRYKITGYTGFGDGNDPTAVFGEAGTTEGPLKANKVRGGWVFTLPPVK